jgi:hypothetical protein
MSTVLVLSGAGPYADPRHRFAETSDRLAMIIVHSSSISGA